MKKVLKIPSWYPTIESPLLGVFFKEQAELLRSDVDLKILIGNRVHIGRKKWVEYKLGFLDQNFQFSDNGSEYFFEYPWITFQNAESNLRRAAEYYSKVLSELNWWPDLIHAQSNIFGGMIGQYLKGILRSKLLITEHLPLILKDFENNDFKGYFSSLLNADGVSTVSQHARRTLLENIPHNKVYVHGNLVDEQVFKLKQGNKENQLLKIGWVGSLYYRKDPMTFIKVLHELKIRDVNFQATMVFSSKNTGDLTFETLEAMSQQLGLDSCIDFSFGVNREELADFYGSMDIQVCTSVSETFGLIVAEALMCGTPVVSTDNGGCRDIITHGENGMIVDIGDHQAISDSIMAFLKGFSSYDKTQLRESVLSKYGRVAFKKNMLDIYNEVIDQ